MGEPTNPSEVEPPFPLPLNFFVLCSPPCGDADRNKATSDTTWISNGTQHFVLVRLKPGLWLQCHVDPRDDRPEVVMNVLEDTQRGWRDYIHARFNGWHVYSCKVSGVHITDNKVQFDPEALEE